MNDDFFKKDNLIYKLHSIKMQLVNFQDIKCIDDILNRIKQPDNFFSIKELDKVTNQEISSHSKAIDDSLFKANEYFHLKYQLDFAGKYSFFICDYQEKYFDILWEMKFYFQKLRAVMYKDDSKNIDKDFFMTIVISFDHYIISLFIEEMYEFKKDYENNYLICSIQL